MATRRPVAPPEPRSRQPQPAEEEGTEEKDVGTQLRQQLETARDAIDDALALLEEE